VRHAADAHVPEATRTLLIEISRRYRLVGCVSGRRATVARQIVAIGSIAYIGNHGGELLRPGATRAELDPDVTAWSERVREFAARVYTAEVQRARVRSEDKQAIAAFHWRGAPDEQAAAALVRKIADRPASVVVARPWVRLVLGLRPPVALAKGLGVTALIQSAVDREGGAPIKSVLYVGDDSTDIDAFRALRALVDAGTLQLAVRVAVGSEETPAELAEQADLIIDGQSGVRGLLQALL
jgi:trehalose 6-phosphate phosphatase